MGVGSKLVVESFVAEIFKGWFVVGESADRVLLIPSVVMDEDAQIWMSEEFALVTAMSGPEGLMPAARLEIG
jgi:hypothetical protein